MTHMMPPRYNEFFVLSIFSFLMSAEGLAEAAWCISYEWWEHGINVYER